MKNHGAFILLAAGAVLCAAGLYLGQQYDVLVKAMYICLECIGVG